MRLFTLDNQVQICDCLTSFFVSSLLPIKFFISTVDVLKTNFQNIYSVMNSNGTCFEQNRTSRSHTSNDHAVTIDLEGFTISLRFLCVIRSPLRFSTARTNITDMFLSIVATKVENFGSRMPPQESFPRLNPGSQRLRTFPLTSGRKTSQYAQYGRTGCRIKGAGD